MVEGQVRENISPLGNIEPNNSIAYSQHFPWLAKVAIEIDVWITATGKSMLPCQSKLVVIYIGDFHHIGLSNHNHFHGRNRTIILYLRVEILLDAPQVMCFSGSRRNTSVLRGLSPRRKTIGGSSDALYRRR
jgi:hypothetical protein